MYYEVFKRNIEGKTYPNRQIAWGILKQGLYNVDISQDEYNELTTLVNTIYQISDEAPEWYEAVAQMTADITAINGRLDRIETRLDGGELPEPEPDDEYPQWSAPDPGIWDKYMIGAKVYHNGGRWLSKIDFNTYEPTADNWAAWASE